MKRLLRALAIGCLLGFTACTAAKEEPDEELKALETRINRMESELADFKERMKTSDSDRGLRNQLAEDEALLKSRLERLRERARQRNSETAPGSKEPL